MDAQGRGCMRVVVLFDLEGTLVRSMEDDEEAVLKFRAETKEKLQALGIPQSTLGGIMMSTLMRNAASKYAAERFSTGEAAVFHSEMDKFLKHYELQWADRSEVFAETVPTLHRIRDYGHKVGLVTNTSHEAARNILSKHGLADSFDVVVAREDVKMLKPDPEGINVALKRLNADRFVFVGDLVHDLRAAKAAGGKAIIVNRRTKPLEFDAEFVVKSLSDVPDLVERLDGGVR